MTVSKPASDAASRQMLELAKEQVDRAIRALARTTRELERTGSEAAQEMLKDGRILAGAIQLLAREREKIEKSITQSEGSESGYALDLDAAREEIRRRLACLRAAADSGEVPE